MVDTDDSLGLAGTTAAECPLRWAVGLFMAGKHTIPRVCLEDCLEGDPDRAAMHGCHMLREMLKHGVNLFLADGHREHAFQMPSHCDIGHKVYFSPPQFENDPLIMVLSERLTPGQDEAMSSAVEMIISAIRENCYLQKENEGLADEVLRCYEQVNLVFDITGKVTDLTNTSDIIKMLMEKLYVLFRADSVCCIDEDAGTIAQVGGWEGDREMPPHPHGSPQSSHYWESRLEDRPMVFTSETAAAMKRLKESAAVFVSSNGDVKLERQGFGTSMWGLLRNGEDHSVAMGAIRRKPPFEVSEMQLMDFALSYGGQILGNLRLAERLRRTSFEVVRAMVNAIDQKDQYTCGHSERVGFLSMVTGKAMGLKISQLQELEWGGLLHDVGKIGIPEKVLNKPARLTDEEFAIIKHHPARGYAVLKPIGTLKDVLDIVLHHHEVPDGTGYPKGLKGDAIPLLARIVHVVDAFDALTSDRPYRRPYSPEKAISILRQDAGTKFDSIIVEFFIEVWQHLSVEYPREHQKWFASLQGLQ